MSDALPVVTIVPANEAREAEELDENHHIVSEALNASAPGLPDVSKSARTPFIEPSTTQLLAQHSKDPLCHQLPSTVGTLGSDYYHNGNGFLVSIAPIDVAIQKSF